MRAQNVLRPCWFSTTCDRAVTRTFTNRFVRNVQGMEGFVVLPLLLGSCDLGALLVAAPDSALLGGPTLELCAELAEQASQVLHAKLRAEEVRSVNLLMTRGVPVHVWDSRATAVLSVPCHFSFGYTCPQPGRCEQLIWNAPSAGGDRQCHHAGSVY